MEGEWDGDLLQAICYPLASFRFANGYPLLVKHVEHPLGDGKAAGDVDSA